MHELLFTLFRNWDRLFSSGAGRLIRKMGKKRKKSFKVWCFYCEREFEDEKILIQHQKAKHFKCHVCHKKLSTAGGMVVHVLQVHKESITKVPNAKPERESTELEIFGMEGIPAEAVAAHDGIQGVADDEEKPVKVSRMEAPSSSAFGGLVVRSSPSMAGAPLYPAIPPEYLPPAGHSTTSVQPIPLPGGGWEQVRPGPFPLTVQRPSTAFQPLFPIQSTQLASISQPLFPIQLPTSLGSQQASYQSSSSSVVKSLSNILPSAISLMSSRKDDTLYASFTASRGFTEGHCGIDVSMTSTSSSALLQGGENASAVALGQALSSIEAISAPLPASHMYASAPSTSGPSIGPPPVISNKPPGPSGLTTEVYLVWDDEVLSMEERRLALSKYKLPEETLQMSSIDAAIDRRISEGRLARRMGFHV